MVKPGTRAASRPRAGEGGRQPRRPFWLTLLPLAVFAGLAALFFTGLQSGDPHKLPSVLIGKPVPDFSLPPLEGLKEAGRPVPGFSAADLKKGEVSIINVWASWCIPCHQEHPFLSKLAKLSRAPLYGLNYKDQTAAARRFLGRYGNPFKAVGVDATGKTAIDWGVYGVPETFVVDGAGRIAYKHVGPIDDAVIRDKLMPAIKAARAGQ
ncbi:MAG: DsbE family thiol:disulfide interchange protein [Methyloligellaceae bacterium]